MKYIRLFESFNTLLAPNGKPSNLSNEHYKLVRTLEFKEWFGDWENDFKNSSKIIDENGEPLVCYHSSNTKFQSFKIEHQKIGWLGKGFYFSDDKQMTKEYGKILYECFLNIKNPFIVNGDSPSDIITEVKKTYNEELFTSDVSIILKNNEKNGVIFNHWDKGNMFSCFYPNQIRLIKDFK